MGPSELLRRLHDRVNEAAWRRYYALKSAPPTRLATKERRFASGLGRHSVEGAPQPARNYLLAAADQLLRGHWTTFAIKRTDVTPDVDWHLDPKSNSSVAADEYTFAIRTHGESLSFDTKYLWELSRHHHTTVLAMAYWITGDDTYARQAVAHIAAWIRNNPFLTGVHWGSSIELGMRLTAFVWVRRLLEDWPETSVHFEDNSAFIETISCHQWLLAQRLSSGSSANNHLIFEAAGLYSASCAFPWYAQSSSWRAKAKATLNREFTLQTFASGYNRELASEYNGFVLEALLLCLAEGELSGFPLIDENWSLAARISHTLASFADCKGHPPRQGDGDNAHALLLDAPDYDRWHDLLGLAGAVFGRPAWWPKTDTPSIRSWLLAPILAPRGAAYHLQPTEQRVSVLPDAGLAILRDRSGSPDEIYCVFDAGPLGYLKIAAHGHADALSIELRQGGYPILVDPGTFNYTTRSEWRDYFRSTAAHNTLQLGGLTQSTIGGPFIWTRHARSELRSFEGLEETASVAVAQGEHTGYEGTSFRGALKRTVSLNRICMRLDIIDEVSVAAPTSCEMMFHLHPSISCELKDAAATLEWKADGNARRLQIDLDTALSWRIVCGSEDPILGWYSGAYDEKKPTITLVGKKNINGHSMLRTSLKFNIK